MAYFRVPTFCLRQFELCAVALGLLAVSIAGCARLLEPRTSDATYYLLDEASRTVAPRAADPDTTDTSSLSVGLRQPRLASYLDATRIVTRRGPHRINFAEFHRWGEDLSQGISRTVTLNLEAQSGIYSVEAVPWPEDTTFDYIVELHVLRFEGVGPPPDPQAADDAPPPEGHSEMVAQWKIRSPDADTALVQEQTHHRTEGWRVNDHEALVANLGHALDVLADEIGTQIRALGRR